MFCGNLLSLILLPLTLILKRRYDGHKPRNDGSITAKRIFRY
jgi:hypothetical protein